MARVKRGVTAHAKHKKTLDAAKGFQGRRKNKKRTFRALWIQRINAAVREFGLTYSRFISGLSLAGIEVDRKVLSQMAIDEPAGFKAIVEKAKAALPAAPVAA